MWLNYSIFYSIRPYIMLIFVEISFKFTYLTVPHGTTHSQHVCVQTKRSLNTRGQKKKKED